MKVCIIKVRMRKKKTIEQCNKIMSNNFIVV
jgi:hypothetical protein